MTPLEKLSGWASEVTLDAVPGRVVELAKSQILSQLAAVRAGAAHPEGKRLLRAYGPILHRDARRTAFVLSGLSSWLHFDDTAYAGHLGNSTVTVPLAYAYAHRLSGSELLSAVIAANECAARVTAATTLGPFRGQMAAHTHLVGAIAGWSRCAAAKAEAWTDAFGLALAMPPWNLTHGFLGSDARLLSSAVPVRLGLDACVAAEAGLRGAPDILDHPRGFLARFADVPLPHVVSAGLGRRWHTDTLSFKVHPSGPGTDAAVDCAMALWGRLGAPAVDDVAEVVVHASLYTLLVHQAAAEYVHGPDSPVSALVSTTPYPVATALLTGVLTPADFAAPAVEDSLRWALAGKVRLAHDPEMTASLLASDAPFGESIRAAGDRATTWLRGFGGDRLVELADAVPPRAPRRRSFVRASKATPARVVLRMTDGREYEHCVEHPVGAAGSSTRDGHRELMRTKFASVGGSARVAGAIDALDELSGDQVRRLITAALSRR